MSFAIYLYISISMSSAHSRTFPSLHLRHNTFSNLSVALPTYSSFSSSSVASPTSQFILQPFRRFTFVIVHSSTLPSLYLRHSSFSNPSVASSTSQLILQPFLRFSYVTGSSLTSHGEPLMPRVSKLTMHMIAINSRFKL